jgi:hypothetical protein
MTLAPLALVLALAAAPPPAAPTPEVRGQVRALLGAIHGPVPPETFRALGPGVEAALVEFAREDPLPSRRVRALEALAGLGGAQAEATHRDLAAAPSAPSAVRRTAIRGLARLAGPERAPRELSRYLEGDRDPAIRAVAAEALATEAPAESCARVRAAARAASAPARFQRALEACDRAGAAAAPPR